MSIEETVTYKIKEALGKGYDLNSYRREIWAMLSAASIFERALVTMISPETDWENGEIGVGSLFRMIARNALEEGQPIIERALTVRTQGDRLYALVRDIANQDCGTLGERAKALISEIGLEFARQGDSPCICNKNGGGQRPPKRHPACTAHSQ